MIKTLLPVVLVACGDGIVSELPACGEIGAPLTLLCNSGGLCEWEGRACCAEPARGARPDAACATPCLDATPDAGFTSSSDHIATWTPICDATSNCAEADQLLPHYRVMVVKWNLNGSAVDWTDPDIATFPVFATKPFWAADYSIEFPATDGVTFWFRLVAGPDTWTGIVPYEYPSGQTRSWRVEVAR